MSEVVDYARLDYETQEHAQRYKRRVESMEKKLLCQECGGAGFQIERVDEYGGPAYTCGFCRGSGLLTPYDRGQWLTWKRNAVSRKKPEVSILDE